MKLVMAIVQDKDSNRLIMLLLMPIFVQQDCLLPVVFKSRE